MRKVWRAVRAISMFAFRIVFKVTIRPWEPSKQTRGCEKFGTRRAPFLFLNLEMRSKSMGPPLPTNKQVDAKSLARGARYFDFAFRIQSAESFFYCNFFFHQIYIFLKKNLKELKRFYNVGF